MDRGYKTLLLLIIHYISMMVVHCRTQDFEGPDQLPSFKQILKESVNFWRSSQTTW